MEDDINDQIIEKYLFLTLVPLIRINELTQEDIDKKKRVMMNPIRQAA